LIAQRAEHSITVASNSASEAAVPLTVKFSEQFYRKLGHEAVDELVDWFNAVDATYRGDLRELNELNFARFDAKLEQRVAELKAEMHAQGKALIKWMVGLWITAVGVLGGLIFAAVRFLPVARP
jgi:hypothetical protein